MISKVKFEKFTAFENMEIDFSPGVNVFIGENGTGKTHILKSIYAACDITTTKKSFAQKINDVFYPSGKQIGRLVKRSRKSTSCKFEIARDDNGQDAVLRLSFSNHVKTPERAILKGGAKWLKQEIESAYIPVKDMMANAPGFRSLYDDRKIHFEEIYVDILRKAFIPLPRGPIESSRRKLLDKIKDAIEGKIVEENEEFFLKSRDGKLEFTLLAEGFRKLGLLWLLIQNRTLSNGSALFWDEPETNLNPKLMRCVIEILLELQRTGVQIFIATHNYILLKEFDLQTQPEDRVLFHSLYRNKESSEVEVASTAHFLDIHPNTIEDTFGGIIDREINRSMGGLGK